MDSTTVASAMLAEALKCGAYGWRVLPVNGKIPLVKDWPRLATTNETAIMEWWTQFPAANIGLATGKQSNLFVLDVDPGKGGDESLRSLEEKFGPLPHTIEVLTGGGGRHCYFTHPDLPIGNSASALGPGLDVKTDGGQVVAPPSIHPTTKRAYAWDAAHHPADVPLVDVPPWLLHLLTVTKTLGAPFTSPERIHDGQRNEELYKSGRSMKARGYSRKAINAALHAENEEKCDHPFSQDEVETIVEHVWSQADRPEFCAGARDPGTDETPDKSTDGAGEHAPQDQLELDGDIGDLDEIIRRAWAAIHSGNTPPRLFLYGSAPSRIEKDDEEQRLRLVPLTPDRLRFHAAKLARWTKLKPVPFTKKTDWRRVECRPPMDVIFNMLAAPEIPLPVLSRIVEVPVFSDRGTLVQGLGYDAEARLYYQPYDGAMTVSIPPNPTPAELAAAKARLDDVLIDFPFVSEADRTHAIALAVVPFVRDLIDGPTPLHVAEAASPGSGKNLLVEAVLSPSVGRRIGVIAEARDDDEWRKRLTARLREGYPITLIDNLSRPLDSGTVSTVLTARRWEDRLLGKNETIAIPVRTIFVCTANNPVLSMEIARRAIRIRLDPKMDRPWLREGFRHADLRAFVEQDRAALIVALLTLVQGWLQAGRPQPAAKPLGAFESWSTIVGGIVEFAGYQHFLGNALEFYEAADSEGQIWRLFVSSWWDTYRDRTVSAKDLFDIAVGLDGFSFGRASSEQGQRTVLGHSLKKHRDQIVSDFRIELAGTYGSGAQWRLQPVAVSPPEAEPVENITLQ